MAQLTINNQPHEFILNFSALKLMQTKHNKSVQAIADAVAQMDVVTIAELLQTGLSRGASATGQNPAQYTAEWVENALDAHPELLGIVTIEYSNQVSTMYAAVNDWATKNVGAGGKPAK